MEVSVKQSNTNCLLLMQVNGSRYQIFSTLTLNFGIKNSLCHNYTYPNESQMIINHPNKLRNRNVSTSLSTVFPPPLIFNFILPLTYNG